MAACLKVETWRASTPAEIVEFLQTSKEPKERTREALAVRAKLKPVDVYAYLRARFGKPNGFQNFLRKDDSDNMFTGISSLRLRARTFTFADISAKFT